MLKPDKMAEKHNISISDKLYNNIREYCQLNQLKVNSFVEDLLRNALNIEKFGVSPFGPTNISTKVDAPKDEGEEIIEVTTLIPPEPKIEAPENIKAVESVETPKVEQQVVLSKQSVKETHKKIIKLN